MQQHTLKDLGFLMLIGTKWQRYPKMCGCFCFYKLVNSTLKYNYSWPLNIMFNAPNSI